MDERKRKMQRVEKMAFEKKTHLFKTMVKIYNLFDELTEPNVMRLLCDAAEFNIPSDYHFAPKTEEMFLQQKITSLKVIFTKLMQPMA